MVDRLGPLFRTTFRQAEANDTRQYIPHEERDQGKKKQDPEQEKETIDDIWTDDTLVSVQALRTFLIGFLQTLPETQLSSAEESNALLQSTALQKDPSKSIRPKEPQRPTNTKNAKAVRAYQTMAQRGNKNDAQPITPPPVEKSLQSKEVRDIYSLIDNLEVLRKSGLNDVNIKPNGTFLESMKAAVDLALSKKK